LVALALLACFIVSSALTLLIVVVVVEYDLILLNKDHYWPIAIGIIDGRTASVTTKEWSIRIST
jgi:hypothetical protein